MLNKAISRRAALMGVGAFTAWAASPARAMLQGVARRGSPAAALHDLLARMTVEEKAGQLTLMAAAWGPSKAAALNPPGGNTSFDAQLAEARAGRLGGVFNGAGAEMARRMQTVAVRESRLRIPLLFAADVIHGFRTIFPVPLGEAASWDPALAERTARIAAVEAAAAGIDWNFAPMVDIARDARWGRGVEGAGEDVHLGRLFAAARVRGFQGRALDSNDAMAACAKHFAAYGAAEAGLDYNTVDISERTLREIYFPPFQAAFDAGAPTVMAAFNELSGIPATGNPWLLKQVLREEWDFGGLVVSDYTGDEEMIAHGFAADAREATRIAFMAGVDMSMQSGFYIRHLPDLVAKNEVPVARLNEATLRVLALKDALGLLENPFLRIDPRRERRVVLSPAHRAVARDAARRSIVLLKNEGALLPLAKSRRIALVGPFAAGQHDLVGPWVVYGDDAQAIDLAAGMRRAGAAVTVTEGSGIEEPLAGGIAAAVAAARAADVVVLAIGEGTRMSGEAQSVTAPVIPAPQQALAEAVAAVGKPVVVVIKNGRALALAGAVADAPAILVTWFLGTETGPAIADILLGDHAPSGRLPVSFPREPGQAPYYYDHKRTGRPNPPGDALAEYKTHYRSIPNSALYPFGHGLTYGDIGYGGLSLGDARLPWNGALTVRATVTNRGRRAAEEVVQLYVHDRTASVTRPVQQLKGFQRVALRPGESKEVRFTLRREDLLFVGTENRWTVEPGAFDLWVAPSAEVEALKGSFALVAA